MRRTNANTLKAFWSKREKDLVFHHPDHSWNGRLVHAVCGASARAAWGEVGLWASVGALRARLDRERRQACRRGALESWCEVARLVRWARRYNWPADVAAERAVWRHLTKALAFRAAARAK